MLQDWGSDWDSYFLSRPQKTEENLTLAGNFFKLGDFFPDKVICCRIRNCDNVWQFSGDDALHNVAEGKSARPERMCDECFARYNKIKDEEIPCSSPNCEATWTWNRFMQLEGLAQGHDKPPRGFCQKCQDQMHNGKPQEIPCRLRICKNTWSWSARDQLMSETEKPAPRFCDECFQKLRTLADGDVTCRIKGCNNTWPWSRYQQLEHITSGKDPDGPPKRMCSDCYSAFQELKDLEVTCSAQGCTRTWTFNAYAQLEQLRSTGSAEPPADRMCSECFSFWRRTYDRKVPCAHQGCRNTWPYPRTEQLQDWLAGKERPAPRLCTECQEKLATATDKDIECKVPSCTNTWQYSAADQVKDQCLGKTDPPPRRCKRCEEFPTTHAPEEVPCKHCDKTIHWSSYEQLMCELGNFVKPTRCVACTGQELAVGKPKKKEEKEHHLVVKMPSHGRWTQFERTRNWPAHLTYDTIDRVEHADACIVTLGDDLTYSRETPEEAWPHLLEDTLNKKLGEAKVAVVNAGMPRNTSMHAQLRYLRDIKPFQPQLIIFSCLLADSLLWLNRQDRAWHPNIEEEKAFEAMDSLARKLSSTPSQLLYWIPNPIFPHDRVNNEKDPQFQAWAKEQTTARDKCLRHAKQCCSTNNIPILDLYTRFEVNGARSAKRWMEDWCLPNAAGARNIATWFAEHILRNNLIKIDQRA